MPNGELQSSQNAGRGRQRPLLRWAGSVPTLLDWSGRIIAAACLGFMFVLLLANVILRYALGSGIAWAYEIHALLLPWLVAGGIVIAAARGRNIAITLLPEILSPRPRRLLALVMHAAILAISLGVLWSVPPILNASQFQTLSTLGIKQVWGYASLVYAFGGMAAIAAVDILRVLAGETAADRVSRHTSLS